MNGQASPFVEALLASAPHPSVSGERDVYAPLLGAWDARVIDHLPDGSDREQSAEIHFARVLDGRAVQDLWIAPARHERPGPRERAPGGRYGTTLRVYDPELEAWRITWWNPLSGIECRLVGRRIGSRIVQTGTDEDGRPIRWSFDEIGPDSFHWRGERSDDGGRSWICETEFLARRRSTAAPGRGDS
jgi:hypothetical protein